MRQCRSSVRRLPSATAALHHSPARGCLPQILLALVTEERLEVLDGVALDAGQQRSLDDPVQIHERPAAQQLVELDFAGGVAAHEAFQGRGLIRREVIHVGVRVAPSSSDGQVDELLEVLPLLLGGGRPERRVPDSARLSSAMT